VEPKQPTAIAMAYSLENGRLDYSRVAVRSVEGIKKVEKKLDLRGVKIKLKVVNFGDLEIEIQRRFYRVRGL